MMINPVQPIDQSKQPQEPSDWMLRQRLYPHQQIDPAAYEAQRDEMIEVRREAVRMKNGQEDWQLVGPFNVGGRIADIELPDNNPELIYAAAASGGLWKSTDSGKTWAQIFENEYTQSMGDLGVAKSDPRILYLGTGETKIGQGSITYDGYGVFKSVDEGLSWTHVGLENSGSIGRVEVDPTNPDRVFVAALGNVFTTNSERGLYRTLDGGASWENVLFINDSCGAVEVIIHPQNPDIIYTAFWERWRYIDRRSYAGDSGGIWRSQDGGDTWEKMTNGIPQTDIGRIGIGISQSNPDILFAEIADGDSRLKGIYKTNDGGDNWVKTNSPNENSAYLWWYSKIVVDPTNPDRAWYVGFDMHLTIDGGNSWSAVNGLHVDQQALHSHPLDPDWVVLGNDGGLYLSTDGTANNTKVTTLPITQFYTCEVNEQNPLQRFGGTQDNGTVRTQTGNTHDWGSIYGGDGFIVRVDPSNDKYMYAASQRGGFGRSTNAGQSFRGARPSGNLRFNWKTPYVLDPNDPKTLYLGSHKIHRSTNRAITWSTISDDLTNGAQEWNFGTVTSIAVSALNPDILIAGTDDGNVWVTTTRGAGRNWDKVSDQLPKRWVTCVATDPFDPDVVYVTLSGIRFKDPESHIFRSSDLGQTWEDISSNLPDFAVNNIQVDPADYGTYYIATDGGVFVTYNSAASWELFGNGMPSSPVLDLRIHQPTRTLYAANYGRAMWMIPLGAASGNNEIIFTDSDFKVFPNPAHNEVNIHFNLNNNQFGSLSIYDVSGKMIKVLHEGEFLAGENRFVWDGNAGSSRISGYYVCRFISNISSQSSKFLIQ